jgi:hypothetical protein
MQNRNAKMGGQRRFPGFERLEERIAPGAVWIGFFSLVARLEGRIAPGATFGHPQASSAVTAAPAGVASGPQYSYSSMSSTSFSQSP